MAVDIATPIIMGMKAFKIAKKYVGIPGGHEEAARGS